MTANSDSPAFAAGQQHADLFLGFSCFLLDTCQQNGIDDLFFCTREGVFFKAIFDSVFKHSPEISTPRTHLLEASRLSVFPATVLGENGLDLGGLFRLYKKQSPNTLLRSLGLNPGDYADLFVRYDLDPNLLEIEIEFMSRVQDFLADQAFKLRTYPQLRDQKSAALGYLSQRFGECQRIGFVDIGWRGTIQNSIATLMPERQFVGLYMGLALERNIMRPNCEKIAYGPNQNRSREYVDLLHAVNVLEFVCLSTEGSASDYVQVETGQYLANMRINAQENLAIEAFSIPFQSGVIDQAGKADREALMALHRDGQLKQRAIRQWKNLIRNPGQALVDAYFSLNSIEVFGLGEIKDQARVLSLVTFVQALFVKKTRQEVIRFLTYSQWTDGMRNRTDLSLILKWSIFFLMKLALQYKTVLQEIEVKRNRRRQKSLGSDGEVKDH